MGIGGNGETQGDCHEALVYGGAGQLDVSHMVTHRFPLDDIEQAYDVFAAPATSGGLKVVLSRHTNH